MLKTKTKITICLAGAVSFASACLSCFFMSNISATDCTTSPCDTTFQVDVKDVLSVSITTPTTYASGKVGTLLTEQIDISVSTNDTGFVAGIRASNEAATLVGDNGGTLSNLSSSDVAVANFPAGSWGYSKDSGSTYSSLPTYDGTPTVLFYSASAGTNSGTVYLAAKAGYDNPSGDYTGAINISVVSGTTSFDSSEPVPDPVGPDDSGSTPTYHSTENVTTYTTRTSTSSTETTTTEISDGDTTDSYANAQGETEKTESNISTNGSSLPVILAITSAVSAAAGLGFFIVAKRREEEDEDDEQ